MQDQVLFQELGALITQRISQDWSLIRLIASVSTDTIDVNGYFLDDKGQKQWFPMNYQVSTLLREIVSQLRPTEVIDSKIEFSLSKDGTFTFQFLE